MALALEHVVLGLALCDVVLITSLMEDRKCKFGVQLQVSSIARVTRDATLTSRGQGHRTLHSSGIMADFLSDYSTIVPLYLRSTCSPWQRGTVSCWRYYVSGFFFHPSVCSCVRRESL